MIIWQDEELKNVGLPKWPGMCVTGHNITEQQAAEILIRTDSSMLDFEYSGNDHSYCKHVQFLFTKYTCQEDYGDYKEWYRYIESKLKQYKILDLNYLHNNQIISSYVYGPHGWCNWKGEIGTNSYNIGKWPDVNEVAKDCDILIQSFPYLNMRITLFSGETCENDAKPVISLHIGNGDVTITPPNLDDNVISHDIRKHIRTLHNLERERGIDFNLLEEKVDYLKKKLEIND